MDLIAERIRALGAPAPGSYRAFGELSSVPEDDDPPAAMEMVRRLVLGQENDLVDLLRPLPQLALSGSTERRRRSSPDQLSKTVELVKSASEP